ncbi:MAG: hypothetical protein A2Z31_01210 [candidate division NC10 bacterium RBG_16_65_8]|nr:MAG: hypothetical protein A2Z31_01210 [candidate division NC10 bacterium RBG_16_65_8]
MSPMHYSVDDYIDAYVDDAQRLYGQLNAAQKSAIRSMAREDYQRYAALEIDELRGVGRTVAGVGL